MHRPPGGRPGSRIIDIAGKARNLENFVFEKAPNRNLQNAQHASRGLKKDVDPVDGMALSWQCEYTNKNKNNKNNNNKR